MTETQKHAARMRAVADQSAAELTQAFDDKSADEVINLLKAIGRAYQPCCMACHAQAVVRLVSGCNDAALVMLHALAMYGAQDRAAQGLEDGKEWAARLAEAADL